MPPLSVPFQPILTELRLIALVKLSRMASVPFWLSAAWGPVAPELSLPATTLFSYPTLGALSGLLFERLALSDELTLAPVIPDVVPTAAPAAAPALSDDDALAALRGRRPSRRSST